jgi:hypothetical protein
MVVCSDVRSVRVGCGRVRCERIGGREFRIDPFDAYRFSGERRDRAHIIHGEG